MVDVNLNIDVKKEDAESNLESFKRKSVDTSNAVTSAFGSLKAVIGVAVAALATGAIGKALGDGIDSAIKQQDALAGLRKQLELTDDSSNAAIDGFLEFANSMESTTGVADDLVISQLKVAKSFKISNAEAQDLVKAASELSAVTGDSLETSVKKLGKTYAGVTGKVGPLTEATRGLSKAQLAAGGAISAVLDSLGGSAAAKMDTFSGALLKVENSSGNLKEEFGSLIVNSAALKQALVETSSALDFLTNSASGNQSAFDILVKNGVSFATESMITFLGAVEYVNDAIEFLTRVVGGLPLFFAGAGANGISGAVDIAADALSKFGLITEETASGVKDKFETMAKDVNGFDEKIGTFFKNTQRGSDLLQKKLGESADRIIAADNRQIESNNKLNKAITKGDKDRKQSAGERAKAAESAAKLESEIFKSVESDIEKETRIRDEFAARIKTLYEQGTISKEKAARLERQIEVDLQSKLTTISNKANDERQKKIEENIKKTEAAAKETADRISAIASNPIEFAIKAEEIDSSAGVAIGLGITSQILEGAEGARELLSQGAGAIADVFLPGIGGAVSTLVNQLSRGPEENKKMVKEFVKAVPDLIEAIAESMPVIVEAFVDSMVNDGGAVRIAIAIARAFSGEAILKSVGRQIGVEFGRSLNANNIGATFAKELNLTVNRIAQTITNIPKAFDFGGKLAGSSITQAFFSGAQKLAASGTIISDAFKGFFNAFSQIKFPAFPPLPKFKFPALPQGLSVLSNRLGNFFSKTPSWLIRMEKGFETIGNFFADLLSPKKRGPTTGNETLDGIGGAISKGSKDVQNIKLARGITSVPKGFEKDTFGPTFLKTEERVVPAESNRDLKSMLRDYNSGALNLGGSSGTDVVSGEILNALNTLISLLSRPQQVQGDVLMDSNKMGKFVLDLNRRGVRTNV